MPSLAQLIADRFIGQQVNLLRLSASERDKVFTMLGALQARILAKMDMQIPLPGFATFSKQKLQALYNLTDKLIQQQYNQISSLHNDLLVDVSGFQSKQARKIVNALIGVPLMTVGLLLVNLKALVNDDLVDGRPAAYWWDQQAATLKQRYRDEIRQGVFAGDTLGQLKQRIRGTKARNYQDGIMAVTSRNADALIRTSILSVANAARYETLKVNDDVLDGQQWLNTLDPRTCPVCQALGNQAWTFDGQPMENTTQEFPGPPPQHFNCRCTLIPVLKSWAQMQRDAGEDDTLGKKLDTIEDDFGPGERASMGGPVSGDMTYEQWLETQDVAMQKDILGPKRWELWEQDLISVQDMVDQKNRPLTLEDITIQRLIPPLSGASEELERRLAEEIARVHKENPTDVWQPTMTPEDANVWSRRGALPDTPFYHFTTSETAAASIKSNGYNVSNGLWGKGVYLTGSSTKVGYSPETTGVRLEVRVNAKNIVTVQGQKGMQKLLEQYGVDDPSELFEKAGIEGIKIEFADYQMVKQEPWLIIFNKQSITTTGSKALS